MIRDELSLLSAFMTVAEERSFTGAGKKLNVSTSGLSHAVRRLEEQIGVRLLSRTTRSVLPTEAGEELLAHLRPALGDIQGTLKRLADRRKKPVGRVRLVLPRFAAMPILGPKLGQFVRDYPGILLDVTTDDSHLDLVAGGFDAGVQFGEFIAQDMIAVRVSADYRAAIVGAPGYFEAHPVPQAPHDLLQQRCVNFRHGGEGVYRWELEKDDEEVAVGVDGPLILDDVDLMIRAALDGVGLAFVSEDLVRDHLARGRLIRVLDDWCPPYPGFFLYYPSRRHQPAALVALIEALRLPAGASS
jgi:DNA-binding transcriptional LysR family regulator